MVDQVSVPPEENEQPPEGHDEAMASLADGEVVEEQFDRPEWLPDKFNSPEDLANAYQNLEQKLSQGSQETDDVSSDENEEFLEEIYFNNPQLDISIARFNSQKVYLLGEVTVPTKLNITDVPLSLAEALGESSGLSTNTSSGSEVYIIRKGGTEPSFKVTGANPKFLKRNKIYERKIAIIYKGKCIIREGWFVNTNKKELKVFDHDTSQKTEYIN